MMCIYLIQVLPPLNSNLGSAIGCIVSGSKIEICWDLTNAKCGYGLEPMEGFYLSVVFNQEIVNVVMG